MLCNRKIVSCARSVRVVSGVVIRVLKDSKADLVYPLDLLALCSRLIQVQKVVNWLDTVGGLG